MDKYCENMKYEHYENIFTRHKQIELEKKLLEKPFPMKNNLVSVIPLNLFQTWHTKDLPPKMKKCVESVKKENPDFTYYLMDDKDCRQFLIENFDKEIVWAYDSLIPGAYKADLWRYCILYKLGGIYMDIKYQCSNGFRLKALTDKEIIEAMLQFPKLIERPIVIYGEKAVIARPSELINTIL
jgi:mannosyltransferase OCH1-like enzyme